MKRWVLILGALLFSIQNASAGGPAPSEDTQACLDCHGEVHPGIVADWEVSRHARTRPLDSLAKPSLERRLSAPFLRGTLRDRTVGCAECHTMNAEQHEDTFEHNGYEIHVVVSPGDCATCHPVEREQYEGNLMSRAHGNLMDNPVYRDLASVTNGTQLYLQEENRVELRDPDEATDAVSCLFCHGTEVQVKGMAMRETDYGEMDFPVLSGWPSQGVGRVNPDGTLGACTACHTRHRFSIEMARKPDTCSQCHKGPDVPGYKVYAVSKHGNIHASLQKDESFDPVPWTIGTDVSAPTCATCHASLCVSRDGSVIAERTHRMNDRLAWRLFGVYAHPHPESADTTALRNRAGLPLPVDLDGKPAAQGLIGADERKRRRDAMKRVCLSCHAAGWVETQYDRLDRTIETSNEMTLAATRILSSAWDKGLARGLEQGDSPFNEAIEKAWVEQWLFYANSTRYAAAMMGGDYGVFDNGRWFMSRNIQEMIDWLRVNECNRANPRAE